MAHSLMLHVRVDDEIKAQATEAIKAAGLSVSDAVRILLKRVVNDQAFALELKVPNAQTQNCQHQRAGFGFGDVLPVITRQPSAQSTHRPGYPASGAACGSWPVSAGACGSEPHRRGCSCQ